MNLKNNLNTVWQIGSPDSDVVSMLSEGLGISRFLASLIAAKGICELDAAKDYMDGSYELLHDPYLMPDMQVAVERIRAALSGREKILIYGDYDVDGVTSVALLLLYLRSVGGDASYYIPERINEGYGLNVAAIEKFKEQGVTLIITVDSGITATEEVAYAASLGVDVVITDHHACHEKLPDAVAVVNPHRPDSRYPFTELAGVGVVFKLLCALENNKNIGRLCAEYCDIVALGTVADVMPIVGENRVIVKLGLSRLEKTGNAGLKALIRCAFSEKRSSKNRALTASSISFGLAPRINAAGRIGDVNRAVKLLITDNPQEAENIAEYLCAVNRERQLIENQIFEQAVAQIEETTDFENDKVIVLTSDSWHLGVIGIVASKITDRYGLPSILISFDGNIGKGSGRSIKGFNINEAIGECRELLVKYGGHELAAGLTVSRENVAAFRKKINEYAVKVFDFDHISTVLNADMELSGKDITVENALEITKLEPYGLANAEPLFCMTDVTIREIYAIGEGKHLKMMLEKDGKVITAVYFGMRKEDFPYFEGMNADFLFTLGYNDFRGCVTVQMVVRDVRPERRVHEKSLAEQALFADIRGGKVLCPPEHLPNLMNFRTIFLYLRSAAQGYGQRMRLSLFRSAAKISAEYKAAVSSCMLGIALEVFREMGLILLQYTENPDMVEVELVRTSAKVDLSKSAFLASIRG